MRTVLITGGGSGLGRALAHAWAGAGWRVVVTDADGGRAQRVLDELATGKDSLAFAMDVTRADEMDAVAKALPARVDRLDVLVNNAGIASAGRFEATPDAEWARVLEVNLMGVVRGSRCFFPLLKAGGGGHVVNVASFAAVANAPGMAAYNVAKAGVVSLSETLRGEWQRHGIGVSVVCPSFFQTNLLESMQSYEVDGRAVAAKLMASSRIDADDVARYVVRAVERGRFLVIPHRYARHLARLKRAVPGVFSDLVRRKGEPLVSGD